MGNRDETAMGTGKKCRSIVAQKPRRSIKRKEGNRKVMADEGCRILI